MKKISLLFILILTSHFSFAQRALLVKYEDVVARAKTELDSSMQMGDLKEFGIEQSIKGEYIMDITIHEKGEVLTVFAVSNDSNNFKMQNKLKDFVRSQRFSFKLPKGKPYKFQYTFHF